MGDGSARAARTVDSVPAAGNSPRTSLPSLDELRAGDEAAYEKLVTLFSPWMRRVARKHVHSAGLAEDIVQETWLAVLRELDTFQGRSSLKTWIFQILVLRDIQGLSAPEAAEHLGISNVNQRVLLHRARVRLRALLRPCP